MEENFLHKVYDYVYNIIHTNDVRLLLHTENKPPPGKYCPITGLDISMQPKNSKFVSYTGVKWYYEHDYDTFQKVLASWIQPEWADSDIEYQFKKIAHHIRNADSNPRNNTRRKIQKIASEENCLFNNMELIDKEKLREAGYITE